MRKLTLLPAAALVALAAGCAPEEPEEAAIELETLGPGSEVPEMDPQVDGVAAPAEPGEVPPESVDEAGEPVTEPEPADTEVEPAP